MRSGNYTSKVGSTTLRHLQDDGSFSISRSFQSSNYSRRRSHVLTQTQFCAQLEVGGSGGAYDGGDGELMFASIFEELSHLANCICGGYMKDIVSIDDTGFQSEF